MVEKTPILDTFTYIFLLLGILIVGFPIIYAIIAATLSIEDVSRVPMPLIPGDQFWVNMQTAWDKGDLGTQLINSFIMAAGITIGKIIVSQPSGPLQDLPVIVFRTDRIQKRFNDPVAPIDFIEQL